MLVGGLKSRERVPWSPPSLHPKSLSFLSSLPSSSLVAPFLCVCNICAQYVHVIHAHVCSVCVKGVLGVYAYACVVYVYIMCIHVCSVCVQHVHGVYAHVHSIYVQYVHGVYVYMYSVCVHGVYAYICNVCAHMHMCVVYAYNMYMVYMHRCV